MSLGEEEWEKRQLCPDGACVGVIGEGGVCSVCGMSADGAEAEGDAEDEEEESGEEADAGSDADADEEEERVLCPDGTCVGLIGVDGVCKICGARARG